MSIDLNELPACLQPYKEQIVATQKDSIEINLRLGNNTHKV